MTRIDLPLVCGFAAVVLSLSACTKVTTVASESPLQVEARPPAPPLPDLPAVAQPAPPQRVTVEYDRLVLDEPLSFDASDRLGEHQEILAEVGKWLARHPEVLELTVEVHGLAKSSRRKHVERSKALAKQVVDALVQAGVERERLVAGSIGVTPEGPLEVVLRISKRAEDQE
jgi:hypothetical protein